MPATYTVKPGDTLLGIAAQQGISYALLLQFNPNVQHRPDLIFAGETLKLPQGQTYQDEQGELYYREAEAVEPEVSESDPASCPVPFDPKGASGTMKQCQSSDIADILFVTGQPPEQCFLLSTINAKAVQEETDFVEKLLEENRQLVAKAPDAASADQATIEAHQQKQRDWYNKAIENKLFKAEPAPPPTQAVPGNQAYLKAELTKLKRRRDVLDKHRPGFFAGSAERESSYRAFFEERLISLDQQITAMAATIKHDDATFGANAQKVEVDAFTRANRQSHKRSSRYSAQGQLHIVEVMQASTGKLKYMRVDRFNDYRGFFIKNTQSVEVSKLKQKGKMASAADFSQALFNDIKQGITDDAAKSAVGNLEATWKLWEMPQKWQFDCHKEYKADQWDLLTTENGDTRVAVNAEAQLMRLGMQANLKTELDASKGNIQISVGAQADLAVAEGKVALEAFLPYQSGYHISFSYIDANKQTAVYSFGRFRCRSAIELNCFVGVQGSASFQGGVLLSPDVEMGETRSGGVGLKANAFAGAQVGGAVTGDVQWAAPEALEKKAINDAFTNLASIKSEGSVSFGAGAGLDFGLRYFEGQFIFDCSAQLVFGPGGKGGMGLVIGLDQLWELAKVVWEGLNVIGYHFMENVNDEAYTYLRQAAYLAFSDPAATLQTAIQTGYGEMKIWLDKRTEAWQYAAYRQREAETLANSILNNSTYQGMDPSLLPPEAVGMMLHSLVERWWDSFEAQQEKAILKLLNEAVQHWRKFEEVLAHMNMGGDKQGEEAMFDQLIRINQQLDGKQQSEFNRWVVTLAETNQNPGNAFTPRKVS